MRVTIMITIRRKITKNWNKEIWKDMWRKDMWRKTERKKRIEKLI
jgi:hypothetical protein